MTQGHSFQMIKNIQTWLSHASSANSSLSTMAVSLKESLERSLLPASHILWTLSISGGLPSCRTLHLPCKRCTAGSPETICRTALLLHIFHKQKEQRKQITEEEKGKTGDKDTWRPYHMANTTFSSVSSYVTNSNVKIVSLTWRLYYNRLYWTNRYHSGECIQLAPVRSDQ